MTPPDVVHHVYIVTFSTLVPQAKLQPGVSLAVLWRGVWELSFVSDTAHCLIGTNLWLPSWDFLKEFVKGRKENTRKTSKWNWIRWQDIFVPSYHIKKMEGETCAWGTSKHKQKGKTQCETRKGTAVSRHTGQPCHNDPTQVSPVHHSCHINCYCRAATNKNTPLGYFLWNEACNEGLLVQVYSGCDVRVIHKLRYNTK